MAKKRKMAKPKRRAPPARRKSSRRGKAEANDPMHAVFAVIVIVLLGLGIYLYQLSDTPSGPATASNPPAAAVDKK